MICLTKTLARWSLPDNKQVFQEEVQSLGPQSLPLLQALSYTNYVCDSDLRVIVLNVNEHAATINVKAGIFFYGIDTGSCCADDPSTLDARQEYCEMIFKIDRSTGITEVLLVQDNCLS